MSVTFRIETNYERDSLGYTLTCEHPLDPQEQGIHTWERARELVVAHALTCQDSLCEYYGPDIDEVFVDAVHADLHVNVNAQNAADLFALLGLPTTNSDGEFGVGESAADDFLGRVLLAQGIAPADAGTDARTLTSADRDDPHVASPLRALAAAGFSNLVMCAREPGALDMLLVRLAALATAARQEGRRITWS